MTRWTWRIWWCTAHQNHCPVSSFSSWNKSCPLGKGKEMNNHKKKMNGMHAIDNRGGDYSRYLTVQKLFQELTPLLSLMCIPLCAFLYSHSSFIFPGKHLFLPLPRTFKFPIIFITITSTVLLFTYVCVVMYNFVISYNGKKIKIYKKVICTELYFSSFLKMICMVWQRRGQPGEGRASRELCTFYTFVLCTALLILHPIMLLLEPICKKTASEIHLYVNNTT